MTEQDDRPRSRRPGALRARRYPHDLWTRLRAEAARHPLRARRVTSRSGRSRKHADILEIAKQPVRFSSAQGITLRPAGARDPASELVVMLDPPRHGPVRRVANPASRRVVRARRAEIERSRRDPRLRRRPARRASSTSSSGSRRRSRWRSSPRCSACRAPMAAVLRWTNEVIGKEDPEYRQPGESPGRTAKRPGARCSALSKP